MSTDPEPRSPADRPPGPNILFFGVVAVVVVGLAVAALAGDATLAHSNIVFRAVIFLVVAATLYIVVVALWLAWHRKTFKRISAAGATADIPDPSEVSKRDTEITTFMDTTTKALEDVDQRLLKMEEGEDRA